MAVILCHRCDTHVDLDYNAEGHFFDRTKDGKYDYEYVCEHCLTDEEIEALENEQN